MGTKTDSDCLIFECRSCNKTCLFVYLGRAKTLENTVVLLCAGCGRPDYFLCKEKEDGSKE